MTNERIKELGIIKMNDYLATGTRQQFWEEYYVKVVMQVRYFFLIQTYDILEFFNESIIFVCIYWNLQKANLLFPIFRKKVSSIQSIFWAGTTPDSIQNQFHGFFIF